MQIRSHETNLPIFTFNGHICTFTWGQYGISIFYFRGCCVMFRSPLLTLPYSLHVAFLRTAHLPKISLRVSLLEVKQIRDLRSKIKFQISKMNRRCELTLHQSSKFSMSEDQFVVKTDRKTLCNQSICIRQ